MIEVICDQFLFLLLLMTTYANDNHIGNNMLLSYKTYNAGYNTVITWADAIANKMIHNIKFNCSYVLISSINTINNNNMQPNVSQTNNFKP